MEKKVISIAVTGPESTGKSWLSEKLADHFLTVWVPEFARAYLLKTHGAYNEEDIVQIARGQLKLENRMAKMARGFLFCDTEFLVTKIWSEFRYRRCDPWIEMMFRDHRYDLYLLCDIDLPWEEDPLREHPQCRVQLFNLYHQALVGQGLPFEVIRGSGRMRLDNAIREIERRWPA